MTEREKQESGWLQTPTRKVKEIDVEEIDGEKCYKKQLPECYRKLLLGSTTAELEESYRRVAFVAEL